MSGGLVLRMSLVLALLKVRRMPENVELLLS